MNKLQEPALASLLRDFFVRHLIQHANVSACTVASYRDTFKLLFRFIHVRSGLAPTSLTIEDLGAETILAFLDYLETQRHNSVRSRNLRLTAIRSFMSYVSLLAPTLLPTVQRVLAIPSKRFDKPLLDFLSRNEMNALLAAPDCSTWAGLRDHVMLTLFYNTGARVSEIAGAHVADLQLERSCCIKIRGKGRKERVVPLWKSTVTTLTTWLKRIAPAPETPLFPNRHGVALSRSGIAQRLDVSVQLAIPTCPSLSQRRISPHSLRHTTAMHLLQSGVDITVIALWLGHESPATTHLYIEADLTMKERALARLVEPKGQELRFKPSDDLLAFLDSL